MPQRVRAAVRPSTKMFWIETPTNPMLRIVDIAAMAALDAPGQLVVVDNTFCTPYFQSPLALGADIVIHSATKYIGGHSDVIGGAAMTNDAPVAENLRFLPKTLGADLSPFEAFLISRGAKTLAVRMREHERNAHGDRARSSTERDDVAEVLYPGLTVAPAARARAPADARLRRDHLDDACAGRNRARSRSPSARSCSRSPRASAASSR